MWRKLLAPEVLFLIGTAQALFPYLYWRFYGLNRLYAFRVTYIPLGIWLIGLAAFWLGAWLARSRHQPMRMLPPMGQGIVFLGVVLLGAVIGQLILLSSVYGGIPILNFLTGQQTTLEAEMAIEQSAGFGQMGMLLVCLFLLNGVIVILLVYDLVRPSPKYRLLIMVAFLTVLIAGLHGGKRQAAAITLTFIGCSLTLIFGHPVRPLIRYFRMPGAKPIAKVVLILVPLAFVALLGWMTRVRSGLQLSGRDEVVRYLEIAIINFEVQAEVAGYGPYQFRPLRLAQYLLPHRFVFMGDRPLFGGEEPPRAEPTGRAGFFGDLHWYTGLPGVVSFALVAGWISRRFYQRSRSSLFHLLVYSQIAWTLFAAHSYNHFLQLSFLPLPAIGFAILARLAVRRRRANQLMHRAVTSLRPASS